MSRGALVSLTLGAVAATLGACAPQGMIDGRKNATDAYVVASVPVEHARAAGDEELESRIEGAGPLDYEKVAMARAQITDPTVDHHVMDFDGGDGVRNEHLSGEFTPHDYRSSRFAQIAIPPGFTVEGSDPFSGITLMHQLDRDEHLGLLAEKYVAQEREGGFVIFSNIDDKPGHIAVSPANGPIPEAYKLAGRNELRDIVDDAEFTWVTRYELLRGGRVVGNMRMYSTAALEQREFVLEAEITLRYNEYQVGPHAVDVSGLTAEEKAQQRVTWTLNDEAEGRIGITAVAGLGAAWIAGPWIGGGVAGAMLFSDNEYGMVIRGVGATAQVPPLVVGDEYIDKWTTSEDGSTLQSVQPVYLDNGDTLAGVVVTDFYSQKGADESIVLAPHYYTISEDGKLLGSLIEKAGIFIAAVAPYLIGESESETETKVIREGETLKLCTHRDFRYGESMLYPGTNNFYGIVPCTSIERELPHSNLILDPSMDLGQLVTPLASMKAVPYKQAS